jgi:hypothetical protein
MSLVLRILLGVAVVSTVTFSKEIPGDGFGGGSYRIDSAFASGFAGQVLKVEIAIGGGVGMAGDDFVVGFDFDEPVAGFCGIGAHPDVLDGTAAIAVALHVGRGLDVTDFFVLEEGTEAGGEFLTTPRGMATLRRNLKLDFEALLKSSKIGGTAPGFEVILARVRARTQ